MIQNPRTDDVRDDDLPQTRYKYATPIDPTVGLHYDRGRWFDPTLGVFLDEDPDVE